METENTFLQTKYNTVSSLEESGKQKVKICQNILQRILQPLSTNFLIQKCLCFPTQKPGTYNMQIWVQVLQEVFKKENMKTRGEANKK